MLKRYKVIFLIISVFTPFMVFSKTSPSYWTELEFSKKIFKNLKLEFNPELRLLNNFKMDAYILEGGLSYKLHKYITIAGYYRYEDSWDYKKKTGKYKGQVKTSRIAFDAKSGATFRRFDCQFRLRYTNSPDFDDSSDDDEAAFLRYRAKIGYNIKHCKLFPYVSSEIFHDLDAKEISKIRYTAGINYPFYKRNEVGVFYRLQDFHEAGKSSLSIIGLGYGFKF